MFELSFVVKIGILYGFFTASILFDFCSCFMSDNCFVFDWRFLALLQPVKIKADDSRVVKILVSFIFFHLINYFFMFFY